jgi:hypothetical protein
VTPPTWLDAHGRHPVLRWSEPIRRILLGANPVSCPSSRATMER